MDSSQAPSTDQRRDAVLYIPGFDEGADFAPDHVAHILCNEADRAATDASLDFAVQPSDGGVQAEGGSMRTICRIAPDGTSTPVLDVYGVDLRAQAAPQHPGARVFTLALSVVAGMVILATGMSRTRLRHKGFRQLVQLLFLLAMLFVVGLYLIVTLVSLIMLVMGAIRPGKETTLPQVFVILGAALGALMPGWRNAVERASDRYLASMRYLWTAGPRNDMRGDVMTMLERICERPDIRDVHVLGYGFGSLVALDALFPGSSPPSPRLDRVATLITIGCPLDLVRTLQPGYPLHRTLRPASQPRWVNVYEPVDVLGSNFRDDDAVGEPTRGLVGDDGSERTPEESVPWNRGESLTFVSGILLASLRVHAQYWGDDVCSDTALGLVVAELFPDDVGVAPAPTPAADASPQAAPDAAPDAVVVDLSEAERARRRVGGGAA